MELIPLEDALRITRHRTPDSLRAYLRRVNRHLPAEHRVILGRGMVDRNSLISGIRLYCTQYGGRRH